MSDNRPRILLLANRFQVRGSSLYTLRLASELCQRKAVFRVVTPDARSVPPEWRESLRIREFSGLTTPGWSRVVREILVRQLLDPAGSPPDLIHIQSRSMHALGAWLARRLEVPYVITVHDYLGARERFPFDPDHGQGIVAVSESVRDALVARTGLPESLVTVIHTGVGGGLVWADPEDLPGASSGDDDAPVAEQGDRQLMAVRGMSKASRPKLPAKVEAASTDAAGALPASAGLKPKPAGPPAGKSADPPAKGTAPSQAIAPQKAASPAEAVNVPQRPGLAPRRFPRVLDSDHTPVVGTAGPLEAVKGLPYFLGAAEKILAAPPPRGCPDEERDVMFLVAGAGPEEARLRRLSRALEIADQTTFIPNLPEFSVALSAMDVYCLPSLSQGLGTIMLEAMALGRPVIATGVGGVYSVIRDHETGLVVPPGDSMELARKVLELLDDPERAREIGAAGQRLVEEKFRVETMIERLAAVYEDALSAGERPPLQLTSGSHSAA